MGKLLFLMLGVMLASGCLHVPFQEAPRESFETADPKNVVQEFKGRAPQTFQLLNSVVFEYLWQTFMAVGYVDVDRENSLFKVVCLNPMGVQLFALTGDRKSTVTESVMPALLQYGDLPSAVGADIRRIYFDLVPSDTAAVEKNAYNITFSEASGSGIIRYEFAGVGRQLVEKAYYENDELIWRISYYEYRLQNGKQYPQGIILENYAHGYQLTVRQKELYQ